MSSEQETNYSKGEQEYLDLCKELIGLSETAGFSKNRTEVPTVNVFGRMIHYDLSRFPLFTHKKVFFRGIVEELLWFIKGRTSCQELSKVGVKIWEPNSTREFLDSRGLTSNEVGDLGPIYGFQWRYFGAEYVDCHTDYTNKGVDQLAECIRMIREDPHSRRIILTAWNPAALDQMALPPCHMMCQFIVSPFENTKGKLSCLLTQRSCDMGHGVPFNVASYALLTYIIAKMTDLTPGEFIHSMGDVHIYKSHIPALTKVVNSNKIYKPPQLVVKVKHDNISDYVFDDFELTEYESNGIVRMPFVV